MMHVGAVVVAGILEGKGKNAKKKTKETDKRPRVESTLHFALLVETTGQQRIHTQPIYS